MKKCCFSNSFPQAPTQFLPLLCPNIWQMMKLNVRNMTEKEMRMPIEKWAEAIMMVKAVLTMRMKIPTLRSLHRFLLLPLSAHHVLPRHRVTALPHSLCEDKPF